MSRIPRPAETRAERLQAAFTDKPTAEAVERTGPDYLDPAVQHAILNPQPITLHLVFEKDDPRPPREISVRTALTPKLVNKRLILDHLESMSALLFSHLMTKTPDRKMPSATWITDNMQFFGWAASTPDVREEARTIIAMLAEVPRGDIEDGLDSRKLAETTIALITIFGNFTKNEAAGRLAPASEPAPSTPA